MVYSCDQTSFREREVRAYVLTMLPYMNNKVLIVYARTACFVRSCSNWLSGYDNCLFNGGPIIKHNNVLVD